MQGSLVLKNPTRQISRLKPEAKDFSVSNHVEANEKIKIALESSLVTITLQNTKAQEIDEIILKKEPLITERNRILDNPIKYFLPFYRKKLREIDAKLDALDLQLYLLETENMIKNSDIDNIMSNAEAKLKKYEKYSKQK